MEWIDNCDRVTHPKLKHGQLYEVRLDSGHVITALFNVYAGGEEVAFVMPISKKELSVTKFMA